MQMSIRHEGTYTYTYLRHYNLAIGATINFFFLKLLARYFYKRQVNFLLSLRFHI